MRLFVLILGMISSPIAWSHGIHVSESGFASGLLHPMTGIDHVLVAAGIGLWLGLQRFTRGSVLLYFAALVAGIAIAGLVDGRLGEIDSMLAATLIITGLFLYRTLRLSQPLVAVVITVIFSCHFHAHFAELPGALSASSTGFYAAGVFISTISMIAAAAVCAARGVRPSSVWTRLAGATIATAGVVALGLA